MERPARHTGVLKTTAAAEMCRALLMAREPSKAPRRGRGYHEKNKENDHDRAKGQIDDGDGHGMILLSGPSMAHC